jgi:hypothetical protein
MHSSRRRSDSEHPRQISQRRKFTIDEDSHLRSLVDRFGSKNWDDIARFVPGRTARQCRDRYKNYLIESIVQAPWTREEDAIVIDRYRQFGPKWAEISRYLSGRSGNHVKNRWHRHLARLSEGVVLESSNESSSDCEEQAKEEESFVLLCPVLEFRQRDWAQLFDRIEISLGYDSVSGA